MVQQWAYKYSPSSGTGFGVTWHRIGEYFILGFPSRVSLTAFVWQIVVSSWGHLRVPGVGKLIVLLTLILCVLTDLLSMLLLLLCLTYVYVYF